MSAWRSRAPTSVADRPSRFDFSKVDADFESDGRRCAGWLYRPSGVSTPRVVVMAPGFAAERTFGLPAIAERLAEAGYAAFLFDYRHFGDSEGTPRQLVSVDRQLADWRAALAHVRRLDGVDGRRPVLWGASLAGGHVLRLAAEERPAAVVAVTPMVDGHALARTRSLRTLLRGGVAAVRDRLGGLVGRPYTVPVAGDPGEFAALVGPGVESAVLAMVPDESDWRNEVPARSLLSVLRYRPVRHLDDVSCPTLVLAAGDDEVVPPPSVERAADALPEATYVRLPVGHFGVYEGRAALDYQRAFLDATL
ncbi:alpha/beta hydrolase [Salinirarus marinus]|uniref:alpha/beta hydrolase n=1 Tax=Salinirarus marinus TaxID=3068310 RepID=UPI003C6BE81A